mmetsp:Transcript_96887/g.273865  ORF Transcript_96887/g.273865 Transcript_96887/m.273865 type:complete len:262 (+) Transcript_96887:105-890(+)
MLARLTFATFLSAGVAQHMQTHHGVTWQERGGREGFTEASAPVVMPRMVPAVRAESAVPAVAPVYGDDVRALRGRCKWLEMAERSGRVSLLKKRPFYQKLKERCSGILEAQAYNEKEALETRCAWLKSLADTAQLDTVKSQKWYPALVQMCSGVPEAEMQDNTVEILKQKCVWVMLAEMNDRSGRVRAQPWYQGLREQCVGENGAEARAKAFALTEKFQGAVSVAQQIFGAMHGNDGDVDNDDSPDGSDDAEDNQVRAVLV